MRAAKNFGVCSVVERGGVGEVGVGFVVAAEDGGEAAQVVADRDCQTEPGSGHLIGPRREPVEQRCGIPRVSACDGGVGVAGHRA